jgi:tetratricopeptide (TPR) repeat protein
MSTVCLACGMRLCTGIAVLAALLSLACGLMRGAQQGTDVETNGQTRDELLQSATRLIQARQLEKAESAITPLLQQNPNDIDALTLLGQIREGQHRLDDAMTAFESLLKAQPKNAAGRAGEVRAGIAAALEAKRLQDNDGAMVYLVRARKYVPDDAELLEDFGVQADTMHLYKDAEEALTRSLELRPDDAKTIYALGHLELDEQKMPQAEAHLRQYLKARPEDASAHYGLGKLLHMLARDDEAEEELRRSIELRPRQTESYYELAEIELDRHENDAAAELFGKVLERNPKHGGALTGMGIVAYRNKEYAKAESYLKSAVAYAPDYAAAHSNFAMLLTKLGRTAEAEHEVTLAKSAEQKEKQEERGFVLSRDPSPH